MIGTNLGSQHPDARATGTDAPIVTQVFGCRSPRTALAFGAALLANGSEAAAHHVLCQAAFAHLLEDLAHLRILPQQLIHILHAGTGADRDPLAA